MRFLRRWANFVAPALVVLLGPGPSYAEGAARAFRPFAPDSIWNLRLRDDAALRRGSARYVDWLNTTVRAKGSWINSTTCTMHTYWAAPGTRKVRVRLDHPSYVDNALQRAWASVPIPAGARPADCGDRNLAVLVRRPGGTVRLWEFWGARRLTDGSWSAKWGGATSDVAADRGVASPLAWRKPPEDAYRERASSIVWNVSASSMSMIAGVITRQDLERGRIDHALAIATPDTARGVWLWPAQRSDGSSTERWALPEGAHLRLDPRLDVERLPLTPLVRMMARAAQRYGIVLRDRTADRTVFMTDHRAGQSDLVSPLLDRKYPSVALQRFPWGRLQLLDAPSCSGWSGCRAPNRVAIDTTRGQPARVGRRAILDTTNSTLDQPRVRVAWDLDGDGSFERSGGARVRVGFVPRTAGTLTVGVRITTRDGTVAEGSRRLRVRAR